MPPTSQEVRLPPLKYLITGGLSFFFLALLSVREHSDKFSGSSNGDVRNARLDPVTGAYVPVRKPEMIVEGSVRLLFEV